MSLRASSPSSLVLLVENHIDTREMYAEWLMFSGFRVEGAATVDEAMEKVHRLRPDIVTIDIGLGAGGDGCDLCARLKAADHTKAIIVIVVTGWVFGGHIERARQAGCDSVLTKPCLPDELGAEICRLLNVSKPKLSPASEQAVRLPQDGVGTTTTLGLNRLERRF